MPKHSAGVLMYRILEAGIEVFLVHPGGPFWSKKDLGAWSIPKGEYGHDEAPEAAAAREFQEETGFPIEGSLRLLGTVKQAGGKLVTAWCIEGDADPAALVSNTCIMQWPPRSGRSMEFPEVDAGAWFPIAAAQEKILKSQAPLLDMLERLLNEQGPQAGTAA